MLETSETPATPVRILLLEDDPHTIRTVEAVLSRNGYVVNSAGNSAEALLQMRSSRPDLLVASAALMGEQSPEGCAFVNDLRREEIFADLPVIVLRPRKPSDEGITGYLRGEERGRGMQLVKPFNPQELLALVRHFLS